MLGGGSLEGRGDVGNGSEQYETIVLGRKEAATPPEGPSIGIDSVHDKSAAADEARGCYATLERMFQQPCANALPFPALVGRELSEQQARHGIRGLACPDRSRQNRGHDRRGRETVVADYSVILVNDDNGREPSLLIRQSACL